MQMDALLQEPAVQAGVAPLLVALVVAALAAWRHGRWPAATTGRAGVQTPAGAASRLATALAGAAVVAALLTTLVLTTGISFTPLSASRKLLLVVLLAPVLGALLDMTGLRHRALLPLLALALGGATLWIFQSVWAQAERLPPMALGVVAFVAVLAALVLRLRDDAVASAAATLGLGLAVAVSAVLAASIGTLMNGMAVATAGGALLLLQLLLARAVPAGWTAVLTTAAATPLMAAATLVLADLRWPVLPALALVPLVAGLPLLSGRSLRLRVVVRGGLTVAAALLPIALAWWGTQAPTPAG